MTTLRSVPNHKAPWLFAGAAALAACAAQIDAQPALVGPDGSVEQPGDTRAGDAQAAPVADGPRSLPADRTPTPDASGEASPPLPTSGRVLDFQSGFLHTCVLHLAGTVSCWGANASGQVGDGTQTTRTRPVPIAGLADIVQVDLGASHTCAVGKNGKVWCWGKNNALRPTEVAGLAAPVKDIGLGDGHTCALIDDGRVTCWGDNDSGELGDGTTTARPQPVLVTGLTDAVQVSAGVGHTCARRRAGDVVCWGDGTNGVLGNGASGDRLTPTPVVGLTDAIQIAAGAYQNCALRANRSVVCWGRNNRGELGIGTLGGGSSRPVPVMGVEDAVQVVSGQHFECARHGGGQVTCWGDNRSGQMGGGSTLPEFQPTPQRIPGITDAVELETGGYHIFVTRRAGSPVCWGAGSSGQLGLGDTARRTTPTAVPGL